jgi:holliday junction DNA helicase RuvB
MNLGKLQAELDRIAKCANCKTFNCSMCEYESDEIPQEQEPAHEFLYRPKSLDEYIGQQKAKDLISLNIRKIQTLKPVHFLISGPRGTGKTTLAHIIKHTLNTTMIDRIAGDITNADRIKALTREIEGAQEDMPILFLDEIHALKGNVAEMLYPLMEDFRIAGRNIRPFILVGATTEKNILLKNVAPLVDRFQVQIELESYTAEDIQVILEQYKKRLFDDKRVDTYNYTIISHNCKYTPRTAISLLEDVIVEPDIRKVLQYHRIIGDGLTDVDKRILEVLREHDKPIGGAALAMIVGISEQDYIHVYENYLVAYEYIIPTQRGRVISEKGIRFLGSIKS